MAYVAATLSFQEPTLQYRPAISYVPPPPRHAQHCSCRKQLLGTALLPAHFVERTLLLVHLRPGNARCHSRSTGQTDGRHYSKKMGGMVGLHQSIDDKVQRKLPQFYEGQDGPPLRILPIGGLGEIGMNCMLVGHYDRYILVDAGLMFPDYEDLGVQKILPDTGFIRRWRHKIEALIITHGHEDHIGALPWVFPILDPSTHVYATSFTMELIKRRLDEYAIKTDGRLKIIDMKARFNAGPFEVEAIRVTHSIPDCCGLILRCQDGTIFHSGDWKIDESPVDNKVFDRTALEQIAKEGVTLMMSDSTNVLSPGRTTSEADVAKALMHRVLKAKGRVITTQFASNVHRLGSVRAAAEASGRKLVFLGLSLRTYLDAAWRDGQAPFDPSILVKPEDMDLYAPRDLLIVTTGSQAEPRAALNLASLGNSRSLKLNKNDIVLYSAKMIPGNEVRVMKMMNRIAELGPNIAMSRSDNLHTSGHAYRDELEEVIRLVRPHHFMPVHGEYAFLKEHERLGKASGIKHTAVIKNGEMLGVAHLRNRRAISTGFHPLGKENLTMMYSDGDQAFGTAADLCIGERMRIALHGIVIASIDVLRKPSDRKLSPRKGEIIAASETGLGGRIKFTTRCLWLDRGKLLEALQKAALAALSSLEPNAKLGLIEHIVGQALRKVVQKYSNRKPDVIVIAMESGPPLVEFNNSNRLVHSSMDNSNIEKSTKLRHVEDDGSSKPSESAVSVLVKTQASIAGTGVDTLSSLPSTKKNIKMDEMPVKRTEEFHVEDERKGISHDNPSQEVKTLNLETQIIAPTGKTSQEVETTLISSKVLEAAAQETSREGSMQQSLTSLPVGLRRENASVDVSEQKDEGAQDDKPDSVVDPPRRRNWKTREILLLINARKLKENDIRQGQGRKSLWRDVSAALAQSGYVRSPEQCKSVWFSMVKKYKNCLADIKNDVNREQFFFYDAMNSALSEIEAGVGTKDQ